MPSDCSVAVLGAPRLAAMSLHLFAGLRVRELQAARPWYERLGRGPEANGAGQTVEVLTRSAAV